MLSPRNGQIVKPVFLVASFLTLQACTPVSEFEVKEPLVEVFEIPQVRPANAQLFPAVVYASELTELSFRVSGQIVFLKSESGTRVKMGEVLAQIDPRDYELELNDKKAKVEFSKVTLDRARAMVAQENMSQSKYDELEAQYRIDEALFEQAKANLSYATLKAPFDGVIASVPAENFENTSIGKTVLTMHKSDSLEVKVDLPDVILAAASKSHVERQQIELDVILDAYPDHVFKGSYKEHTAEQNQESKSFTLTLTMDIDPERVALQGMPGSVEIDLSLIKAVAMNTYNVPLEAVKVPDDLDSNSDSRVVWRLNGNTVERVLVTSNSMGQVDKMAITGDIKPGDLIVTAGMNYLKDGMTVKVKEQ